MYAINVLREEILWRRIFSIENLFDFHFQGTNIKAKIIECRCGAAAAVDVFACVCVFGIRAKSISNTKETNLKS